MELDSLIDYIEKLAAKPVGVAIVGVFKDGKLLLGRRRDNEKWTQPGGHMEEGEKPIDGAVRELKEEAGLDLSADRFQHVKSMKVTGKNDKQLIIHCFVVKLKDGESTTVKDDPDEEVYKWHWLTPETIQSKEVWSNLHVPPQKNVLFKALGWAEQEKTAQSIEVPARQLLEKRAGISQDPREKEYAPGLPVKGKFDEIRGVKKPETWELVVQKHDAEKRGTHYDLRLGDPKTKHGHSWALPKTLPQPGEYIDIPRTETHTIPYFDFKGTIPEGTYGTGKVKPILRKQVEVYRSAPDRISFILSEGTVPQRFTLVGEATGTKWRLVNSTPTMKKLDLPKDKVKVKKIPEPKFGSEYTHTPKLSGAHGIIDLPASGKLINVFSYRTSKRNPHLPIDHTFKFHNYQKSLVKPGMGGSRLRGEIMGIDKKGKPIDEQVLGGMLNSTLVNSRDRQRELGATLKTYLYNIDKFKGRDVRKALPSEKDKMLKEVYKTLPKDKFELLTPEGLLKKQKQLIAKIKSGKHPLTREGSVMRHEASGKLFKYRLRPDYDVYVRDIYQEVGKNGTPKKQAGGFRYSMSPKGPIVGGVGTGFSRDLKQDMWQNKNKYIGKAAKVTATKQSKTGALFQPAFTGEWHIEKGKQ